MAIDPNKKFLYINRDTTIGEMDEALCFPVSSFIGAETQTSSLIDLYFKGSKGTDATVVRIVHESHGFIKTFYTNLVNEINFGEEAFINIYDHGRRNTFPSDISYNVSTDVQPTFTLEDTDFIVADSISIGGHSVNDIDVAGEFVDSDEHLMTSAAINDRIAAAGGGVSVSDSTANTAFPVVFHDESNNLHDDTGTFTYNPFTGLLTSGKGTITSLGTDALTVDTSINLGHASDTTLARSAAGTVTIEGNQIVTAGDEVVSTGNHILKQTKVTIDTAGFNGLNSTPVELVAAQGANKVIVPTEVVLFHDRASTQSNSVDLIVGFNGTTSYLTAVKYLRRYMQNVTTDRTMKMGDYAGTFANDLTTAVNSNLTIALGGTPTTNCVTSLTVYTSYYVIDIS
jgi:hypothetical protein